MITGEGGDGVDLTGRHRVHPALVLRVADIGASVVPLDAPFETRQEYDRLADDQLARVILAGGARTALVARLVPGAEVIPAQLVEKVAGDDPDLRRDLEALCVDLVTGGLLEEPVVRSRPPSTGRLAGYSEPAPAVVVPDIADDQLIAVRVPLALVPDGSRFVLHGHDGAVRCRFDVAEIRALEGIVPAGSIDGATTRLREAGSGGRTGDEVRRTLRRVVRQLATLDLVELLDPSTHSLDQAIGDPAQSRARSATLFEEASDALRHQWEGREDALVVVPVDVDLNPPLALGTITAYAKAHLPPDVADRVVFLPRWHTAASDVPEALAQFPDRQLVFLYSLYIWNHRNNLEVARTIRALRPTAVNIAGGPDLPKYEQDNERYLREHPEIDVAVRGEGEATLCGVLTALARHGSPLRPDPAPELDAVEGISFLRGSTVVRTPDRERLADLDEIPSPFLTGLCDHIEPVRLWYPILESNRGCPYGCTFCDWGSATLSRIRKFDLDRVKAEIDWVIDKGAMGIGFADANFGMLDRDVEIVEHLIALRERTGRPTAFGVNMAKNRVGNTLEIASLLAAAGILGEGLIATQTYDPGVLRTIRRANIRPAVFDDLATDFRRHGLPLSTDLMLGLPGSTPDTFRSDLQRTVDTEVHARTHPTQLLVNSPMNAPAYREEHRIVGEPGKLVTSTATYNEAEWRRMMRTRQFFYLAERRGMLRQLATYVRAEVGVEEMMFYDHLQTLAETSPEHPQLAFTLRVAAVSYLPPGHWSPVLEEVGQVMVDHFSVPDDRALRAVMHTQLALQLSGGRAFPISIDLDHDVVAWHREVVAAKLAHPDGSWPARVAPLRSLPPGRLHVADRRGRSGALLGKSTIAGIDNNNDWELDTPLARPVTAAF